MRNFCSPGACLTPARAEEQSHSHLFRWVWPQPIWQGGLLWTPGSCIIQQCSSREEGSRACRPLEPKLSGQGTWVAGQLQSGPHARRSSGWAREGGLIPSPAFCHLQLVTPPAREAHQSTQEALFAVVLNTEHSPRLPPSVRQTSKFTRLGCSGHTPDWFRVPNHEPCRPWVPSRQAASHSLISSYTIKVMQWK